MDKFSYTPDEVFNDTSAYSDPQSESEVREQLSRPHKQVETYINNTLIPAINKGNTDIQSQIDDTLTPAIEARMKTATYDADGNGTVDNAEKVNGHTVKSDVPENAKFTDTTYQQASETVTGLAKLYSGTGANTDGSMTQAAVTDAITKAVFGDIPVDTEMSDTSVNPVQNKTVKEYIDNQLSELNTELNYVKTSVSDNTGKIDANTTAIAKNTAKLVTTTKSFTLSAANWEKSGEWDKYTISDSLVTATSNQEVVPSSSISREQLKALQKANLVGSQENGKMHLWVYGTVPTIDIPITIIFRGDK